jgi:Family of unknown function (DUF6544)
MARRMFPVLVATVALVAGLIVSARIVFERRVAREIDALLADARPTGQTVTERDLESLPEPVQRWLRHSKVIGSKVPTTGRLQQDGQFQMDGRGWMRFTAEQYFTIDPPGFVWKATFRMAPMLSVTGRDQYRGGEASMDMRVLSIVPAANKTGGGLNQGDLLRFLGEMQWFPAAALANDIAWKGIDAESAEATMSYGGIAASMTFTFAADGRLIEACANRYNDSRGRNEKWMNRNDSDQEFGGIRVPVSGEARWEYDTGPYPYIRWRITALDHDRPARFSD